MSETKIKNIISYKSGNYAKKRLKSILIADRIGCTPDVITHIREDISKVMSGYLDIDSDNLSIQLSDSLILARIPVCGSNTKREKEKHESDGREEVQAN